MLLIADSGSTKTDWCFVYADGRRVVANTDGINPIVQSECEIKATLSNQLVARCRQQGICTDNVETVHFYGAGCLPAEAVMMENLLSGIFDKATGMHVYSDLLAACHALCGHDSGIACILGTGSNSCLYDGEKIIRHTPPLGYILGDEGSGAVLGRMFLNGILKGSISAEIRDQFYMQYSTSAEEIIKNVYHSSMPNRYLASMSVFISQHIENAEMRRLVVDNFVSFIERNVMPYRNAHVHGQPMPAKRECCINAVGSIAFYYRHELELAARKCGYTVGTVVKSPLERLADYYQTVI